MGKVISVINQKGGVGKTNISVHLACELAHRYPDLSIAIADADRKQKSALQWLDADGSKDIKVVLVNDDHEGTTLSSDLKAINADIVILDTPGQRGNITLRAAMYADVILVPIGQGIVNIRAVQPVLDTCAEAKELRPNIEILLVPSNIKNITGSGRRIRSDLEGMGRISKATISQRQDYENAGMHRKGLVDYAPRSEAHKEICCLLDEILPLLGDVVEKESIKGKTSQKNENIYPAASAKTITLSGNTL